MSIRSLNAMKECKNCRNYVKDGSCTSVENINNLDANTLRLFSRISALWHKSCGATAKWFTAIMPEGITIVKFDDGKYAARRERYSGSYAYLDLDTSRSEPYWWGLDVTYYRGTKHEVLKSIALVDHNDLDSYAIPTGIDNGTPV